MSEPTCISRRGTLRPSVILLSALAVYGPLAIDMYLPAMPAIGSDLHGTPGEMQWTLTAFLLGFCLCMLVYGPLSDSWGRRKILAYGIGLFTVASAGCAFAPDMASLTVLRFVQAMGGGAVVVMGNAIVRDVYSDEECPRIMSMIAMVTALTPMLAPLLGSEVLRFTGWQAIFLIQAVYSLLVQGIAWVKIPESLPAERRRRDLSLTSMFSVYAILLTDRAAWGCILCAGGTFAAMFAYIAGSPFVYIEFFGLTPQTCSLLLGLNIVFQMTGTYTNTRLLRTRPLVWISYRAAWFGFVGAAALLIASVTGWGGFLGIVVPLIMVMTITLIQASNLTARLMSLFPDNAGAAAAALASCIFGLGTLSSLLVSLLNDGTPLSMGLSIFLCCAAALAGISPIFTRPGQDVN